MKRKRCKYRAGITDRKANWIWQGEVVACNILQAKKILNTWQKKNLRTSGSIEIDSHSKEKTNEKLGVY